MMSWRIDVVADYARKFLHWTIPSGHSARIVDEHVYMSIDTQRFFSDTLDVFVGRLQGQDERIGSKILECPRKLIMRADCSNDLWAKT